MNERAASQGQESGASRCSRCGAAFRCGMNDPGGCWCAQMPPLAVGALESGASCLCPACLGAAMNTRPARREPV